MSDTKIPASEVTPGMRFRSLGSGYISREVTAVHTVCPCRFGVKALNGPDRTHICRQTVMLSADRYAAVNDYVTRWIPA